MLYGTIRENAVHSTQYPILFSFVLLYLKYQFLLDSYAVKFSISEDNMQHII